MNRTSPNRRLKLAAALDLAVSAASFRDAFSKHTHNADHSAIPRSDHGRVDGTNSNSYTSYQLLRPPKAR